MSGVRSPCPNLGLLFLKLIQGGVESSTEHMMLSEIYKQQLLLITLICLSYLLPHLFSTLLPEPFPVTLMEIRKLNTYLLDQKLPNEASTALRKCLGDMVTF